MDVRNEGERPFAAPSIPHLRRLSQGMITAAQFYAEAKGWQTAIGSVLGFVALALGAWINFTWNRTRDTLLREEEARSVTLALAYEILFLRRELARVARFVAGRYEAWGVGRLARGRQPFDSHFLKEVALPDAVVFDALRSKLGLQDADTIASVLAFHADLNGVRQWLPLISDDPSRGYGFSPTAVLEPALKAVEESSIFLAKVGIEPEFVLTGAAASVIDMENESLETARSNR